MARVALLVMREPLGSEVKTMQFNYAITSDVGMRWCPRCGSRRVWNDGELTQHPCGQLKRCSWCGFFWGEPEVAD